MTRETLPMNRLIRFCVSPERMVVPDLANKLPGRGMWVTADRDLVETACGKGLFAKAAHAKVTYPEDMDGLIKSLFVKRLQSLLGLAKKAGLVVSGFEKTICPILNLDKVPFSLCTSSSLNIFSISAITFVSLSINSWQTSSAFITGIPFFSK